MWRGRPDFTGQCSYELLLAYRLVILYERAEKKICTNIISVYFTAKTVYTFSPVGSLPLAAAAAV